MDLIERVSGGLEAKRSKILAFLPASTDGRPLLSPE
jgi:hypothetical protein